MSQEKDRERPLPRHNRATAYIRVSKDCFVDRRKTVHEQHALDLMKVLCQKKDGWGQGESLPYGDE